MWNSLKSLIISKVVYYGYRIFLTTRHFYRTRTINHIRQNLHSQHTYHIRSLINWSKPLVKFIICDSISWVNSTLWMFRSIIARRHNKYASYLCVLYKLYSRRYYSEIKHTWGGRLRCSEEKERYIVCWSRLESLVSKFML